MDGVIVYAGFPKSTNKIFDLITVFIEIPRFKMNLQK